jgi:hypothetical protein
MGNCLGTKVAPSSKFGCDGLGTPEMQTRCKALLNCLQTHPTCSATPDNPNVSNDPTACFCGTLSASSCAGATPANIAGTCASAYFAVYGGATTANRDSILSDFFARNLPVGMANNLYACDVNSNCQSQCP